jgi:uncharacterized heparinase superfamily protein
MSALAALTVTERLRLATLAFEQMRGATSVRFLRSPLMRWRYRPPAIDELSIIPPDLRTPDPSFATEVAAGHIGLAGRVVALEGRSPFLHPHPDEAWWRELQGFGWLRHLDASRTIETERIARRLVLDWLAAGGLRQRGANAAAVLARRIISWTAHAGLLLDGADRKTYTAITQSLGQQLCHLSTSWRGAPPGYPRLLGLIACLQTYFAIAGRQHRLQETQAFLVAELERQILRDGGHISRNPALLVEVLLDLLPLRQCYIARAIKPAEAIIAAMRRIPPMLRYLRLGDGKLARFNGMGQTQPDALATILAFDEGDSAPLIAAPYSHYVRIARGATILLVDVGAPPPLEHASTAHAGCLSFEMSSGAQAVFVNAGAPAPADAEWRAAARATASHNTLCLGETSSSRLIRSARLERQSGGHPIFHPNKVIAALNDNEQQCRLEASHDGYLPPFGLMHTRCLQVACDGLNIEGFDRLAANTGTVRFARDKPFSVHFHLHPKVEARQSSSENAAEIVLTNGERWTLSASGAKLTLEESTHLAIAPGPCKSLQIVLRGSCFGETEVGWSLKRVEAGRTCEGRSFDPESVRLPPDTSL